MVKLKKIRDNRESKEFAFRVFLCKRPEIYPSWNLDVPESDEEEAPQNPFFCMQVSVKVLSIDSLQKKSGLVVVKLLEENHNVPLLGRRTSFLSTKMTLKHSIIS